MKHISIIVFVMFMWGTACTNKPDAEKDTTYTDFELAEVVSAKENIETVCYACHSPSASPDDRFAPPLEVAKRNYLSDTAGRDDFVEKMVQFVLYPTAEQSVLHSDVEQYGLMDPVGFSEDDVRAMAEYIYDNELEKPDWLLDN